MAPLDIPAVVGGLRIAVAAGNEALTTLFISLSRVTIPITRRKPIFASGLEEAGWSIAKS